MLDLLPSFASSDAARHFFNELTGGVTPKQSHASHILGRHAMWVALRTDNSGTVVFVMLNRVGSFKHYYKDTVITQYYKSLLAQYMMRFKAVIPNQGYHIGYRLKSLPRKDFALTDKTVFVSMA